jgi:sortase A
MTSESGGADSGALRPRRRKPQRRRVSVVGVLGEVLITGGVFVLLFLGWQLWLNDIIQGGQEAQDANKLSQSWQASPSTSPATTDTKPTINPVVEKAPTQDATKFAVLYVPRFGTSWERPIAQGVGVADVLDAIGVGHYPGSAMPGQVGNFAIAAHRHAYGGGFENLHLLHVGDHVYIGTKDGWYEYTFRNIQYVQPTQVNVLQPVPMEPGVTPTDRLITMTTCNPFFSTAERMVAYGEFVTFYPRAGGPPSEIADTVNEVG